MPDLITPYCTVEWADAFFGNYCFDQNWSDASPEKKASALAAATDFIDIYCAFYDDKERPFEYDKAETDDFTDSENPRRLKQACAQEAAYLLSLDDNPAEPHPLTILGLLRTDSMTIDARLVPPIFSKLVSKLLEKLGGVIDPEANGSNDVTFFAKKTT